MSHIENRIAVVSQTKQLAFSQAQDMCAAVDEQLSLDAYPIWGRRTHVLAVKDAKSIPQGYWPAYIQDDIHEPGAAGYHSDRNNQPIIFVQYDGDNTSLTLSHECVETIPDPFGNRLINVSHPTLGAIQILCEICDPPEEVSYLKKGIKCSDFILPEWYDSTPGAMSTYSFTGACKTPLTLLPGGYFSFIQKGKWKQATLFSGAKPVIRTLGKPDATLMLREWVDKEAALFKAKHKTP